MKYIRTLCLLVYFLYPEFLSAQPGSSCSTPYVLIFDGVERSYATATGTGSAVVCSGISGSSQVTFFSLTTNATAEMPLLNIHAPGGANCEVAFYAASSCTNGNLEPLSSLCLYDAEGLWSPAHDYTLLPNTVYKLRIKTASAGNILIAAQFYTPPNNKCSGALQLGPTLVNDNNATQKVVAGITPGQLCATTLENTAFYTYTVENTGPTTLSIENTACDNGNAPASVGFQVGFFTGSCSSLFWLQCYHGVGANIQATTGILTAGTKIFVAVDGIQGSNCGYSLRAINSVELSAELKYFTAWKTEEGNLLKWVSIRETNNETFEIQRSFDGVSFSPIGKMPGQRNSNAEKTYQFRDPSKPEKCYYRLRQISTGGKSTYSTIVKVDRSDLPVEKFRINNPVSGVMNMTIAVSKNTQSEILVLNMNGQVMFRDRVNCLKGTNNFEKSISSLPAGIYSVAVQTADWKDTQRIIKL